MNTEIYRIDGSERDAEAIQKAGDIIRAGGLVGIPTETVYGLGASALSPTAAGKIYSAKGRPSDNPLIVHISEPKEAENIAFTNSLYYLIAEHFMPGPITVILPKKDIIPTETTGGLDSVAIRCPENRTARAIIKSAGVPVAAPSANTSGSPSPTTAEHVYKDLSGALELIIDDGPCKIGVESTVVSVCDDKTCKILRPGAVTAEMLSTICESVIIDSAVVDPSKAGLHPSSPGMKYKHYSPVADVYLIDGDDDDFVSYVNSRATDNDGVFSSVEDSDKFKCKVIITGNHNTPEELIHSLFSCLRKADDMNLQKVFIKKPPMNDLYLALYNRLIRSAGGNIIKLN